MLKEATNSGGGEANRELYNKEQSRPNTENHRAKSSRPWTRSFSKRQRVVVLKVGTSRLREVADRYVKAFASTSQAAKKRWKSKLFPALFERRQAPAHDTALLRKNTYTESWYLTQDKMKNSAPDWQEMGYALGIASKPDVSQKVLDVAAAVARDYREIHLPTTGHEDLSLRLHDAICRMEEELGELIVKGQPHCTKAYREFCWFNILKKFRVAAKRKQAPGSSSPNHQKSVARPKTTARGSTPFEKSLRRSASPRFTPAPIAPSRRLESDQGAGGPSKSNRAPRLGETTLFESGKETSWKRPAAQISSPFDRPETITKRAKHSSWDHMAVVLPTHSGVQGTPAQSMNVGPVQARSAVAPTIPYGFARQDQTSTASTRLRFRYPNNLGHVNAGSHLRSKLPHSAQVSGGGGATQRRHVAQAESDDRFGMRKDDEIKHNDSKRLTRGSKLTFHTSYGCGKVSELYSGCLRDDEVGMIFKKLDDLQSDRNLKISLLEITAYKTATKSIEVEDHKKAVVKTKGPWSGLVNFLQREADKGAEFLVVPHVFRVFGSGEA